MKIIWSIIQVSLYCILVLFANFEILVIVFAIIIAKLANIREDQQLT
jgi:hypothetical protein